MAQETMNDIMSAVLDGCRFSTFGIPSGTNNFTVSNAYRGILFILSSSTNACGEYLIFSTNSGVCDYKTISALGTGFSIDISTNNTFKIIVPSGSVYALFITVNGSVMKS